ncbi:MAG: hypothetical protein ACREOD_07370 [Candidatus Dormibacteria bacterium]
MAHFGRLTAALGALGCGVLMASCNLGPTGSPNPAPHPSAPSSHRSGKLRTALDLYLPVGVGRLTAGNATVACGPGDRSVTVKGSIQGSQVTVRLTHLHPGQKLMVPPPVGTYADAVTVTSSSPSPALTWAVGNVAGTYQGVGSLDVSKRGNSGSINVSAASPEGQSPSLQFQSGNLTEGGNGMGFSGTWFCK